MARGGYRKPEHPAPVSGPGAMSRRTDGGPTQPVRDLPNPSYGEGKDFRDIQGSAPMEGATTPAPSTPFDASSARPSEPVTAGAAAGPGPGPEAAGLPPDLGTADYQAMKALIPGLEIIANLPQSNPSTRAFVRRLKSLG